MSLYLILCRQTHLLESHVSGLMVKKEMTEEGEVQFCFCFPFPMKYNTLSNANALLVYSNLVFPKNHI